MTNTPTVEVEIRARLDTLERDLARARSRLDSFGKTGAGKAVSGLEVGAERAATAFQNLANQTAVLQGPLGPISGRFSAIASGLGRVGVVGLGAGLALTGLAATAKKALDAFTELEKQQATYIGVLRATSYAAGKSADDIENLAEVIRHSSLATLGSVRAASAILLTFRSVSGDAFDEALKLSQDLAAVGFGSITTAATMMGKALEDPIMGLTAMRRVGVTFSEAQKVVIQNLVDTGQRAKAMEEILKGVRSQVGGAGAVQGNTLAGAWHQLSESTGNWLEMTGAVIAKATGIDRAIRGIASAIDAVNERAAAKTTPEGRLRTLTELRDMGVRGLEKEIAATQNLITNGSDVVRYYETVSKELTTYAEQQKSAKSAADGAVNTLKLENDELRRTALGQEIYNAVKKASQSSSIPLSDARKSEIEAMVKENFYLKNGTALLNQRIALLGPAAAAEDRAAAKVREINDARKAGVLLLPQEIDLIKKRAAAQAEEASVGERAAYGLVTAQEAQRAAMMELEVVTRTYNLTAEQQAGALNALSRKYRDVYENSTTAGSTLPELTRASLESVNSLKQLDALGVSTIDRMSSALTDVALGAKTFQAAMKDLATAVLRDLTQMIIKALLYRAVMSFLPGVGNAGQPTSILPSFLRSAKGNAFVDGSVVPFASGGVVSSPIVFPMADGGVGLAGERPGHSEGILPLQRLSNGDLGVGAAGVGSSGGVNVQVHNYAGAAVETSSRRSADGSQQIDVVVRRSVEGMLLKDIAVGGPISRAYEQRYKLDRARGAT